MGRVSKSTKKFTASGKLKKTIQDRRKHQAVKKRIRDKKAVKPVDGRARKDNVTDTPSTSRNGTAVDDFLDGKFMDIGSDDASEGGDEQDLHSDSEESEGIDEGDESHDGDSFAPMDEFDEGKNHLVELSKLAENDPEFYKYLQENDHELLDFDPSHMEDEFDDDGGDEKIQETAAPVLTMATLRKWQKALLEQRSLRALRKLFIAFRSAVYMNEEDQVLAWTIDNSSVYQKLVITALKYTPVVLQHHIPYKVLPNGKIKYPAQTEKLKALQKPVLSYFHNIIGMLPQVTDHEIAQLSLTESAKLIPYIAGSRKAVKLYLKKCLEFWVGTDEGTSTAAFAAIQELTSSRDESIMDMVLKGTYLTLVRSFKATNTYNLPSINLMKNSAAEVFCIDYGLSYQLAFGYIRQLAIHLRNSMKLKTKDSYKRVYNWQYVHCIDFWSIVLSRACDTRDNGNKDAELKPLIYPLVQVALGAIKLISNAHAFPFHFQMIRSLLRLADHTHTYIPIAPYLLPIISSNISSASRLKPSTLHPLDLEVQIRIPQQYLKTRVCAESLLEEASFLLAEWLASRTVHGSIAFPEMAIPVIVQLRKALKSAKVLSASKGRNSGSGVEAGSVKTLVERIEESARWVELKRNTVMFAPGQTAQVEEWEAEMGVQVGGSPLSKYVKVLRTTRDKRRMLVAKATEGEDEFLSS